MKRYKTIIFLIISLCAGFYLTKMVDEIALFSSFEFYAVYFYFTFILYIIIWNCFKYYISVDRKKRRNTLIISFIFTILLAILMNSKILPNDLQDIAINITSLNEKNIESQGYETWISYIKVDGNNKDLGSITLSEGWSCIQDSNTVLYTSAHETDIPLYVSIPAKNNITIAFMKHPWSGSVNIIGGLTEKTIDLYSKEGAEEVFNIEVAPIHSISDIVLIIGFSLISMLMTMLIIMIYFMIKDDKRGERSHD